MRALEIAVGSGIFAFLCLSACGLESITQGGKAGTDAGAAATDAGDAGPALQGAGCGVEGQSNVTLCAATSMCPQVVVDTQAFPNCGFRIRGGTADLVCVCGDAICSMGPFTTCPQATSLLSSQTEQGVCAQVAEDRCTPVTGSTSSSSSSSSSSSGGSTCDKACLAECGGGAGCASVCGC